jgi:hypothetical protein
LVLAEENHAGGALPEVLIAPASPRIPVEHASSMDVVCPGYQSPTGELLVVAAWAMAPIPSHCLSQEIGTVDPSVITAVLNTYEKVTHTPGTRKNLKMSRAGEPEWHRELRRSLMGYWDGSVMISCATMPDSTGEE